MEHQDHAIEPTEPVPAPLPSALDHLEAIRQTSAHKQLVIFLDYDGTLTPIVPRPEDANLAETMRAVLGDLARTQTVAIVTGRDLQDVQRRVALDTIYYAGSHGFEIAGPNGLHDIYAPVHDFLSALDAAETALCERLHGIPGAQVERKHFAIAIHYRRVSASATSSIHTAVEAVQQAHPSLRQTGGKKVFELRPTLDWHKGTALFWLLDAMGLARDAVLLVYIGDDVTDEDAFAALPREGIGILVAEQPRQTAARYQLASTEQVGTFLMALTKM